MRTRPLFLPADPMKRGVDLWPSKMIRARWKYGLVLIGLALLHADAPITKTAKAAEQEGGSAADEENGDSVERRVEQLTRALAPVLLPMIDSLGALELEGARLLLPPASDGHRTAAW